MLKSFWNHSFVMLAFPKSCSILLCNLTKLANNVCEMFSGYTSNCLTFLCEIDHESQQNYSGDHVQISFKTACGMKLKLSVIRQKGKSQNECCKKTKHAKFFEKRIFLTLWYAHVAYQEVRNICFSESLTCFVLLYHLFWDPLFYLITDELSFTECN